LCIQYTRRLARDLKRWVHEDSPLGDVTTDAVFWSKEDSEKIMDIQARSRVYVVCPSLIEGALGALGLEPEFIAPAGWTQGVVVSVRGLTKELLMFERTLLNFLIHVFSISTEVRRVRELLDSSGFKNVRVAVTRKTVPGMRLWAKLFARAAGADTHRLSLSDMILIKDTHINAYGDLLGAVRAAKENASFTHKIEVEVSSEEEAFEVLPYVDAIMLDNVGPEEAKRIACKLKEAKPSIIVEVSGGINRENVLQYVNECVDVVSMGYLTLSPPLVDLGAEIR